MKVSSIKPGDVIEWTEILDRHRGWTRAHKITVVSRQGRNIEDQAGDWKWWPDIARWKPTITPPP